MDAGQGLQRSAAMQRHANHDSPVGQRRAGFSLVELMVVIAVIVILIALLLPALGMVRARGRQSQCASNQRQLWSAWTQAGRLSGHAVDPLQWTSRVALYLGGGTTTTTTTTTGGSTALSVPAPGAM